MGYFIYSLYKEGLIGDFTKRQFHYALRQILKLFKQRIAIFELLH
jgi:hypothetical protein